MISMSTPEVNIKLHTIDEAIEAIRTGQVIIVVDDEDRENEGDFICAAECVTPEIINFMATHGRGLICTPLDEQRADELNLHMMVRDNTSLHETAFTVSIDLIGHGCTTGISAYDRAKGIRAMVDKNISAGDFARPGHIFPLRAKTGGVLRRTGHTEAAIDLARLAGFYPAGVLVEILNEDGSMARLPQLMSISQRFGLKIISIKDLVEYRMRTERIVEEQYSAIVPSRYGPLEVKAFQQITTGDIHLAFIFGKIGSNEAALVRVHSAIETGDILGLVFDDYDHQLRLALMRLAEEGQGVLLYMRHHDNEHLVNRLKLLAKGEGVPKGNQRDFGVGAQILRELGINKIRLLTKNPKKRVALEGYGLEIESYVLLEQP